MNTSKIYVFIAALWLQLANTVWAQSTYQLGGLPAVNFNNKLKNDWSLNFRTESRMLVQSGEFGGNDREGFEYVLSDFSVITAKKIGLNTRVAGGYLIRFRERETIHRLIQQFTVVQKLAGFRLSHRIVSDQTFSPSENPEYRLRYRLTTEIPLSGQAVDAKEFYLKINNEYLNSVQNGDYDLEIRLVPLLGYDISTSNKVEAGVDYRVNSFLSEDTRHSFWFSVTWFIEI